MGTWAARWDAGEPSAQRVSVPERAIERVLLVDFDHPVHPKNAAPLGRRDLHGYRKEFQGVNGADLQFTSTHVGEEPDDRDPLHRERHLTHDAQGVPPMMLPQMSTEQEVRVLRTRYPDGLVCDGCARLVATRNYGGRPYRCAFCLVTAPALAREAEERLATLKTRPKLPDPSKMRVWAKGDGDYRKESLALMGVPVESEEPQPKCLVEGRHLNAEIAAECPVLGRIEGLHTLGLKRTGSTRKFRRPTARQIALRRVR